MARGLHRVLLRCFPSTGNDAASLLPTVVWAALRGFVLTRMMTPGDHDFGRERDVLVDLISTYIDTHTERRDNEQRPNEPDTPAPTEIGTTTRAPLTRPAERPTKIPTASPARRAAKRKALKT